MSTETDPRDRIARTLCDEINGTARFDELRPDERAQYRRVADRAAESADRLRHTDHFDAAESLTYHFRLAFDNDYEIYRERCEVVRDHLAARDDCPVCDGAGTLTRVPHSPDGSALEAVTEHCGHCHGRGRVKRHPHQLGERLKDWAEMLVGIGEDGASGRGEGADVLRAEMLSTALAWVNWDEIAAGYIEERGE